jgi:cob(I)alamin adenosyltransferase
MLKLKFITLWYKDATQEQDDRTTVMEDHMKRVQEEITATQQRVEAKKKEILSEEHLKTMTTFQAARLKVSYHIIYKIDIHMSLTLNLFIFLRKINNSKYKGFSYFIFLVFWLTYIISTILLYVYTQREVGKMEREMHEMMEHLRNFRVAILVGNDKLEKIRQVQQWSEVIYY